MTNPIIPRVGIATDAHQIEAGKADDLARPGAQAVALQHRRRLEGAVGRKSRVAGEIEPFAAGRRPGVGELAGAPFDRPAADEAAGRGYVRAKTGTLLKVSSLSGVTTTEDGRLLVYSFVVNDLTDLTAAKDMLDRSAAALTRL